MTATVIALWACVQAEPAAGHVDVRPDLVEQGDVVEVRIEVPLIIPGPDLVRLEIEGDGIEVLSTRKLDIVSPESHWTSRLRIDAPVGRAPFVLRAFYADGDSVEFQQSFTVVPGEESSFPLVPVLVSVGVALSLAVVALVLLRRRA